MCKHEDCYFISIIEIGEGETIYIHYREDLFQPPILIQHFNASTKLLAEYPLISQEKRDF